NNPPRRGESMRRKPRRQPLHEGHPPEPLPLPEIERVSRHQDRGYSLLAEGGKRVPQLRKIACFDRDERQSGLPGRRLGETQVSRKVRVLRFPSHPIRDAFGTTIASNSRRFGIVSSLLFARPVTLPPG